MLKIVIILLIFIVGPFQVTVVERWMYGAGTTWWHVKPFFFWGGMGCAANLICNKMSTAKGEGHTTTVRAVDINGQPSTDQQFARAQR